MNEKQPSAILVLYTELAGYTVSSLKALEQSGTEVHLVRWPVNAEAPFEFSFSDRIKVYDRKAFDEQQLLQLAKNIAPSLILCSGWNDKAYLAVCKAWKKHIPVILAMDNKWNGGVKQQIARVISGFTILKTFTHCWVPGEQQKLYAKKLGFAEEKIRTGFYTCDTQRFSAIYEQTRQMKLQSFPHVFIYAGRYYEFKGVKELWSAFIRFKKETPNNWKLVCLGVGDIEPVIHPDIEHKGFVQPDDLPAIMKTAGVFILPSRIEPWAVVVQEFATAGFPLLLSREVGAAESFLEEESNGFSFCAGDELEIVRAMKKIAGLSDVHLSEMGNRSHNLAVKNTPERWAQTLLSFVNIDRESEISNRNF